MLFNGKKRNKKNRILIQPTRNDEKEGKKGFCKRQSSLQSAPGSTNPEWLTSLWWCQCQDGGEYQHRRRRKSTRCSKKPSGDLVCNRRKIIFWECSSSRKGKCEKGKPFSPHSQHTRFSGLLRRSARIWLFLASIFFLSAIQEFGILKKENEKSNENPFGFGISSWKRGEVNEMWVNSPANNKCFDQWDTHEAKAHPVLFIRILKGRPSFLSGKPMARPSMSASFHTATPQRNFIVLPGLAGPAEGGNNIPFIKTPFLFNPSSLEYERLSETKYREIMFGKARL